MYSAYGTKEYNDKIVNQLGAYATFQIPINIEDLIKMVDDAALWNFEKLKQTNQDTL